MLAVPVVPVRDPLLFHRPCTWGQESGPGTWIKRDFFATVVRHPDHFYAQGLVIQAAFGLLVVLSIPAVVRRFGWRYGAYTGFLVLVPGLGSQDFQGLGRYLLGRSPRSPSSGRCCWRRDRPCAVWCSPLSAVVLVVFTGMFANGRYLS